MRVDVVEYFDVSGESQIDNLGAAVSACYQYPENLQYFVWYHSLLVVFS